MTGVNITVCILSTGSSFQTLFDFLRMVQIFTKKTDNMSSKTQSRWCGLSLELALADAVVGTVSVSLLTLDMKSKYLVWDTGRSAPHPDTKYVETVGFSGLCLILLL